MATMILVLQAIGLVKEIDALQETRMAKVKEGLHSAMSTFMSRFCLAIGVGNALLLVPLLIVGAWVTALLCLGGAMAGYLGGVLWRLN